MLEPRLKHNRDQFDRLHRGKKRAMLVVLVSILPVVSVAAMAPDYAMHILMTALAVSIAVVLSYEVRKTVVFRRDLREQRESAKRRP